LKDDELKKKNIVIASI